MQFDTSYKKQVQKINLNPSKIIIGWTLGMIVLRIIAVLVSIPGSIGGEQKPETTFATIVDVTFVGAALLSISTSFFYWSWFKKNL